MNDKEIWEKVKKLKGIELLTFKEKEPNYIFDVEDNNKISDRVIIFDRVTSPTREDIIAAYQLFIIKGNLNRKKDLEWLARPEKKVSSIVFRIIGEVTKPFSKLDKSKKEPVLILIK